MQKRDFYYELPDALIAQRPLTRRSASRLLTLDGASGQLADRQFEQLPRLLDERDLLVFNDTRVIPARLLGSKESGGRIEALIERVTGSHSALAQVRASKSPGPGTKLVFASHTVTVSGRKGDLFALHFDEPVADVLEAQGHVPLPPYIERADDNADIERYQTVYARNPGAVAAPTAGLHFSDEVLAAVAEMGVRQCFVTLHVGAGTFQPMRGEDLDTHRLHHEWINVSPDVCNAVAETRHRGGRVIAVGTTSLRALESAARQPGGFGPMRGDTDLFLYPGAGFLATDALLTNFHLPESTLLMLVCAFAGYDKVMHAYRLAVAEQYRFFSYGDAMFVTIDPAVCDRES
ncbi:MAG: tRNA preQ1(34) S-adenosylmethionine ribosyltransferase-isomerase QueA [Gammaproteobacteria bacterium]|nr:tRNA preQ1(34) S-adenosylmethionine ribosyltransferase-isomerase QueA [Gammaproteobacteria bacterium]